MFGYVPLKLRRRIARGVIVAGGIMRPWPDRLPVSPCIDKVRYLTACALLESWPDRCRVSSSLSIFLQSAVLTVRCAMVCWWTGRRPFAGARTAASTIHGETNLPCWWSTASPAGAHIVL